MSTPLICAVTGNHYDAAILLLQYGAKPDICDDITNKMPIHIAVEANRSDIVRLLIEHGANPNATTCCYNSTILCHYRYHDDRDMIRFIESHGGKAYTALQYGIKDPCIVCVDKMWTGRYNRHLEVDSYSCSDNDYDYD